MTSPADRTIDDLGRDRTHDIVFGRARAESWIEEKLLRARETTRDKPIRLLAIAAGVGAMMGAIFFRI